MRRLLMKMWLFAKSCKYYEIHTWKGRRLNSPANNAWYIHALLIYTKICTRTEWSLLNKIWLLCTYCLRYGHFLHCAKFQQWLSDVTHKKHFLLVILYCYAVFFTTLWLKTKWKYTFFYLYFRFGHNTYNSQVGLIISIVSACKVASLIRQERQ